MPTIEASVCPFRSTADKVGYCDSDCQLLFNLHGQFICAFKLIAINLSGK